IGLWKSDGTSAGTVLVSEAAGYPGFLTPAGSLLYFVAGHALWRTDGTPGGALKLYESPGINGDGGLLAAYRRRLYFRGPGTTQSSLWRSDGTVRGTQRVANVNPLEMAVLNDTLFIAGFNVANGAELWRSNGTAAGTTLVTNRIDSSSDPSNLREAGGLL